MVNIKQDTRYRILNFETGTYLSISREDDTSIVGNQYKDADKPLQEWKLEPEGGDFYFIVNPYSGRYITINSLEGNLQSEQVVCKSRPLAGVWRILSAPHTGTAVRITPFFNQLCIDINDASRADGAKVQLWPSDDANTQLWVLEEVRPDQDSDSEEEGDGEPDSE